MITNPSTDGATFVKGDNYGNLGARDRLLKNAGEMRRSAKARLEAMRYGLPQIIRGNPLGCSCFEAHLASVSAIQSNGEVEADYHCDAGWHNFVVFQLKIKQAPAERQLRIDSDGNLAADDNKTTTLPGLGSY